jgi:hypothetical protein
VLAPAVNSIIKMIMAFGAIASFVRRRPHATTPTKGRLIHWINAKTPDGAPNS